jgi:hypothetical protein
VRLNQATNRLLIKFWANGVALAERTGLRSDSAT